MTVICIEKLGRDGYAVEASFCYPLKDLVSLTPAEIWGLLGKDFAEGMEQLYQLAMKETGREP